MPIRSLRVDARQAVRTDKYIALPKVYYRQKGENYEERGGRGIGAIPPSLYSAESSIIL